MKFSSSLFKQPVLIFLILGILLFVAYSSITTQLKSKDREIIIEQADIAFMAERFIKTWNREPSEEEIQGLIENRVMEEVFYKEAVAMGLDKKDQAVKRRMRQLMEAVIDEQIDRMATENELQGFMEKNPDKFREEPRYSFQQIAFPAEDRVAAIKVLGQIEEGRINPEEYAGSMFLLPSQLKDERRYEVARIFGDEFTETLSGLETGTWQGPVASAYGWHLVLVNSYVPGRLPDLNEVWDLVEREWAIVIKEKNRAEQYKKLKDRYDIKIIIMKNDK